MSAHRAPPPNTRRQRIIACGACGREQALAEPGERGGVTVVEAQELGWTVARTQSIVGKTVRGTCPFCASPS